MNEKRFSASIYSVYVVDSRFAVRVPALTVAMAKLNTRRRKRVDEPHFPRALFEKLEERF